MNPYYASPAMTGMGGGMDPRMQGMPGMQGMMHPGMMNGIHPGMMGGMGQMGGNNGMGLGGSVYGQAHKQLGYDYQLPALNYTPDSSWGAWDIANARYTGARLDRPFLDNIISSLTGFFANRHLSEEASRDAHRRVYYRNEGEDAGNKTLGAAAAYQAFLVWDRDHHSTYHFYPSQENQERLVGLAVAELLSLWDCVTPHSPKSNLEEASQYAAATAKHLHDRHYMPAEYYHPRFQAPMANMGGAQGPMPGQGIMGGQGMMPGQGMMGGGMGMGMPGYSAMGMPGPMQSGMTGQGMMGGGGMMPGMGVMGGGSVGMGGMGNGMPYGVGAFGMGEGREGQAGPGMHPYTYGGSSGVAYGNQAIDPMGHPLYPGGQGRAWYGYGQPRY